jgi:hypothetical protein
MLGAEDGKPIKPLDKSVQPPADDQEVTDSGATWDGGDDEAISAHTPELPSDEDQQAQPQHQRGHGGGILGWLFGNGGDEQQPPPPPPRGSSDR